MLFQERLYRRPFWMLVACVLVNQTTWRQAGPAHRELMKRYTIRTLSRAEPEALHDLLRPLGLWRQRSRSLVRLADAWLRRRPRTAIDVMSLPGCGPYAADSWAIFVEGRYDVAPTDFKLRRHLEILHDRPTEQ